MHTQFGNIGTLWIYSHCVLGPVSAAKALSLSLFVCTAVTWRHLLLVADDGLM